MFAKFLPERKFRRVQDISPQFLRREGIRLVMLDFDNTLMAYTDRCEPDWIEPWLRSLRREGIEVVVISNSRKAKALSFCGRWGIRAVLRAKKPSPKALEREILRSRLSREQCAMVGDLIFTDILAGNRAWVHTYLVNSIRNHNIFLKLRDRLQNIILYYAKRR
jgi:HAD superfamily phosphatase (TIGR01668 family)